MYYLLAREGCDVACFKVILVSPLRSLKELSLELFCELLGIHLCLEELGGWSDIGKLDSDPPRPLVLRL